jgi:hypothetical protein
MRLLSLLQKSAVGEKDVQRGECLNYLQRKEQTQELELAHMTIMCWVQRYLRFVLCIDEAAGNIEECKRGQ